MIFSEATGFVSGERKTAHGIWVREREGTELEREREREPTGFVQNWGATVVSCNANNSDAGFVSLYANQMIQRPY